MASLAMKMVVMIMINMVVVVVVGVINYKSTQFRLFLMHFPSPKIWLAILREQKVIVFFIFFKRGGFVGGGRGVIWWDGFMYIFLCEHFWISQQMFL